MIDKIHIQLLWRTLPLLMALVVTSCSGDDGYVSQMPEVADNGMCVAIKLSGQNEEGTRSEDLTEDPGTYYENYIGTNDLYVMVFSMEDGKDVITEGSQLLEVLWSGSTSTSPNTYISRIGSDIYLQTQLKNLDEYADGKDFNIVALANTSSFTKLSGTSNKLTLNTKGASGSEITTFGSLMLQTTYKYKLKGINETKDGWIWTPGLGGTKGGGIPMFGIKKVNLKYYNNDIHNSANPYPLGWSAEGSFEDDATLYMLRAFAKAEISLSADLLSSEQMVGEISIASATIGNDYADTFSLIPELSRMDNFSTSGKTGQINSIPSDPYLPNGKSQYALGFSREKNKATVYLPEYKIWNASEDGLGLATSPQISLKLKIGNEEYEFRFDLQENGILPQEEPEQPYWKCILRNYCYKYELTVDLKLASISANEWGNTFDNEFTIE